jgi:protein-S-isoprenylcysteine O-methyltransferase Ste14
LIVGWIAWCVPFSLYKRTRERAVKKDRRALVGILLQTVGYSLLWSSDFWRRTPESWQVELSILFFVLACALSWSATPTLGRQWRIGAALNEDHTLVRKGVYALVRHPIYASMLCMMVGTGLLVTPLRPFLVSAAIFLIGTEIRVRVEDGLLAERFGEDFEEYRRSVAAYVPFVV